jgi:hypothetical protein
MEEKLNPDYLSEHISKPVGNLEKKVEDLFLSVLAKNIPDHLLEKFDVQLKVKTDLDKDAEAIKQLESMI